MADITGFKGETLEVDYSITNSGDFGSVEDIELLIDGNVEYVDQDVMITDSAAGTLYWQADSIGTYTATVSIAGVSDQITVQVDLSAIPDSVVQRDADNVSVSGSDAGTYNGIYVTTGSSEWPQIQGRISQNSGSLGNAVVVGPDDTIIQSVDVSALSAGDVVTFDNAALSPSTEYRFALEKADSNTTFGLDNGLFPYTSSDGELEMTAGWQNGTLADNTGDYAFGFYEIGNVTGTL